MAEVNYPPLEGLLPIFSVDKNKDETNNSSQNNNPSESNSENSSTRGAGAVGAVAGTLAGKFLSGVKPPVFSTKEVDAAQIALEKANTQLSVIRNAIESNQNAPRPQLQALEQEYIRRQNAFNVAEQNLNRATLNSAAVPRDIPTRAPTATVQTPESLVPTAEQHSRALQGNLKEVQGGAPITGRASQQTYNEITSLQALSKDKQEATLARLIRDGLVTPEGAADIRLKLGKVASTPSGVILPANTAMDAELRASSAASEAAKQAAVRSAEIERLRQEAARAKRDMGVARSTFQAASNPVERVTSQLAGQLSNAEIKAQIAAAEAERAAAAATKEGALKKVGRFIAGSPKVAGMLGGAGIGMSVAEAIDRFKSGDNSGGVISTLAAAFGGMSMVPPIGPAGLAVKGIGTVGGLATIPAIMLNDYLKSR
jgi:hypothetical protein